MFSFSAFSKLGYHVHLCSTSPLIFGDEETVLSQLVKVRCVCADFFFFLLDNNLNFTRAFTSSPHPPPPPPRFKQESAHFINVASSIFKALSSVVSSFSDEENQSPARDALELTHTPQNIATNPRQHLLVNFKSLLSHRRQRPRTHSMTVHRCSTQLCTRYCSRRSAASCRRTISLPSSPSSMSPRSSLLNRRRRSLPVVSHAPPLLLSPPTHTNFFPDVSN